MKALEGTSKDLEVDSSRKKLPRFENLVKTASSSKYTTHDGSRLVCKTSQDLSNEQNKLFSKKFIEDSRASRSNEAGKELVVSCSTGKVCNYSFKGKEMSRASQIERLSERLKILEEETEAVKQVFTETVEERNTLVNEIYQEFLTILHCNHLEKKATGSKFLNESLIVIPSDKQAIIGIGLSQVLCEDSNPCIVTRDHTANMNFLAGSSSPRMLSQIGDSP